MPKLLSDQAWSLVQKLSLLRRSRICIVHVNVLNSNCIACSMKMHLSPFFCALWHDVKLCQRKVLETLQEEEFFFSVWFCCPGSTVHKASLVFSSYSTHWPAVPGILHLPQQPIKWSCSRVPPVRLMSCLK